MSPRSCSCRVHTDNRGHGANQAARICTLHWRAPAWCKLLPPTCLDMLLPPNPSPKAIVKVAIGGLRFSTFLLHLRASTNFCASRGALQTIANRSASKTHRNWGAPRQILGHDNAPRHLFLSWADSNGVFRRVRPAGPFVDCRCVTDRRKMLSDVYRSFLIAPSCS